MSVATLINHSKSLLWKALETMTQIDLLAPHETDFRQTTTPQLLRSGRLAAKAGKKDQVLPVLIQLSERLVQLTDDQACATLNLALLSGYDTFASEALRNITARPVISLKCALAIQRKAENLGIGQRAATQLANKVDPSQQDSFRIAVTQIHQEPATALDLLRRTKKPRRIPIEAAELAQALIEAGKSDIARRYLRLCHRKWPNAPGISELLLESFLKSGYPIEAKQWLTSLNRCGREEKIDSLWLTFALETGRLRIALALLKHEITHGRRQISDTKLLRVLIAKGQLTPAQLIADSVRSDLKKTEKARSRFNVSFHGQLLEDLKLKRYAETQRKHRHGSLRENRDALRYFSSAKEILDDWTYSPIVSDSLAEPVPCQVFQYWNSQEIPSSVLRLMESWRSHSGWKHRLFNRNAALKWLQETLGPSYARAFSLAKKPAEESDFLRLCLLQSEGGIYADADDKMVGTPESLLSLGPGLILFREPFGAIENNLICAPKGHPIITRAMIAAKDALLRRDNALIWQKTGPGLLTRILAHTSVDSPKEMDGVRIVPSSILGRYVQPHASLPYKRTTKHWIDRTQKANPDFEKALREFVQAV